MNKSILAVMQMQQSDVNPVITGFCDEASDRLENALCATKLSQTMAFKKVPCFILWVGKLESTFSKKVSLSKAITTSMNTNWQAGGGGTHVEYITAYITGLWTFRCALRTNAIASCLLP